MRGEVAFSVYAFYPPSAILRSLLKVSMNTVRTSLATMVLILVAAVPQALAQALGPTPAELDARLSRLERVLENQLLEMLRRMDALQREIQELRGLAERNRYELEQLKTRQRQLYLDIDRRLRALETGGAAGAESSSRADEQFSADEDDFAEPSAATEAPAFDGPDSSPRAPVDQPPVSPPPAAGDSESETYTAAFDLLTEGRYPEAIDAFNQFLAQYPQSGYASNAQYWLAEAYYVSRNFSAAAPEFQQVIDNYPNSIKAPDARLKLGFTYYELGQWDQARAALTEVQSRHSESTVARLAEQRLQRMQQEGH